jgi:3-phosphoshikimate 1-carboxyvinyltransferase
MINIYPPPKILNGEITLSGSKSISNRMLIIQYLFDRELKLNNLSNALDTVVMQHALNTIESGTSININSSDAGTVMRFLTALLAITPGDWHLSGSEGLNRRPIKELADALNFLGSEITFLEKEGYPPLSIRGHRLKGGEISISSSVSSQFISALLLIGATFENGLILNLEGRTVSKPYIDMTIGLLEKSGIRISRKNNTISVKKYSAVRSSGPFSIESDWSSASYWYSICALAKNSTITLKYLYQNSLQADAVLPEIYSRLGVKTVYEKDRVIISNETFNSNHFLYDFTDCPDIAQTVAVTCLGLGVNARLTGLQTLKIKETDRITALANELRKAGADVQVTNDTLEITGIRKIQPGNLCIRTYNDHRMALSFAPLAIIYPGLTIEDERAVSKSYPQFWNDLLSVGFNVNLQPS